MTNYPTKKLGEVCEVVGGGTPKTIIPEYWNGNIVWVTPKDLGKLKEKVVSDSTKKITEEGLKKSSAKLLPKGTVVLSSRAPIGYVAVADVPLATNQGCRNFICGDEIYNWYLYYFLKNNTELLQSRGSGSTFSEISGSRLKEIEIPLPPLAEQKKIVAKIEKLMAKIDEAKKLRAQALADTKNLLPSALHKIFSEGKKKGWEEKSFEEIILIESKRNTKKLPYVGMEDVESGTGKFLGSKDVREVKSNTSYFNQSHVLYGKLRPYLNKVLLPDFEGHCSTEFLPLQPDIKYLTREWLAVWLRSGNVVTRINATNTGARMPRANMKEIKKFKIPLPPLATQKKIVKYLDSLSEKSRRLQTLQTETASDLATLQTSILHKAFNGELV